MSELGNDEDAVKALRLRIAVQIFAAVATRASAAGREQRVREAFADADALLAASGIPELTLPPEP